MSRHVCLTTSIRTLNPPVEKITQSVYWYTELEILPRHASWREEFVPVFALEPMRWTWSGLSSSERFSRGIPPLYSIVDNNTLQYCYPVFQTRGVYLMSLSSLTPGRVPADNGTDSDVHLTAHTDHNEGERHWEEGDCPFSLRREWSLCNNPIDGHNHSRHTLSCHECLWISSRQHTGQTIVARLLNFSCDGIIEKWIKLHLLWDIQIYN